MTGNCSWQFMHITVPVASYLFAKLDSAQHCSILLCSTLFCYSLHCSPSSTLLCSSRLLYSLYSAGGALYFPRWKVSFLKYSKLRQNQQSLLLSLVGSLASLLQAAHGWQRPHIFSVAYRACRPYSVKSCAVVRSLRSCAYKVWCKSFHPGLVY